MGVGDWHGEGVSGAGDWHGEGVSGAGVGGLGRVSISRAGDTQPSPPPVLSLVRCQCHTLSQCYMSPCPPCLSPGVPGDQGDGEAVPSESEQLRAAVIVTDQHQAAPAQGRQKASVNNSINGV